MKKVILEKGHAIFWSRVASQTFYSHKGLEGQVRRV